MIIDCGCCSAQNTDACDDCIVTALCVPGGLLELAEEERTAIDAMSSVGLIAPIRLAPRVIEDDRRSAG
jgi:hypothetical protein